MNKNERKERLVILYGLLDKGDISEAKKMVEDLLNGHGVFILKLTDKYK